MKQTAVYIKSVNFSDMFFNANKLFKLITLKAKGKFYSLNKMDSYFFNRMLIF